MKILTISKGLIHPSFLARKSLEILLNRIKGNFDFTSTSKLGDLKMLKRNNYDVVILYYHLKSINNDNLMALIDFVNEGGGVLALHSAMASLKDNAEYQELLGGRFIGHGKIERIDVNANDNTHPISSDIFNFAVKDELYLHEYDENNEIIFYAQSNDKDEPVMWTKKYGRGRVCYLSLGHCFQIWQHPEVKKIVRNSLIWLKE